MSCELFVEILGFISQLEEINFPMKMLGNNFYKEGLFFATGN